MERGTRTYDIINAGPNNRFMANGRIVSNSGRHIQLQNLPQNHIPTLDEARELVKMGEFGLLESIYGNVPDILSQLIRTMLVPKEGCEFIVADFSAIEARVLAWLAGEQWRLEAFRNSEDIYCASASQMFGVPVVKHGVNGELRQKGKVAELACIAEGSMVLTNQGLVPIENVTTDQLLWDGEEWVSHEGVICKGVRPILHYDGLSATPDHLVYAQGYREPVPLSYAAAHHLRLQSQGHSEYFRESCQEAAKVYDILNAGPRHRFTANGCLVHNCGYQGGAGALISMGALDMGLKEQELPDIIQQWRDASPRIVQFWWDMDKAATETVRTHEEHRVGKVKFQYYSGTLWMVLPSGRKLAYLKPKLQPNRFGRMSLTFEGVGSEAGSGGWSCRETYGGKLAENCVAEGTLVMSNRGLVPIEDIEDSDLVWDGIEWVKHEGMIDKGERETVSIGGIHLTPDHKILTEKGWVKCAEADRLNWAEAWFTGNVAKGSKRRIRQSRAAASDRIIVRPTGLQERVYDIRNCGPRHRFAVYDQSVGKLRIVSNCTQATARDILTEAMWRLEQAGFEIIAHVHDEVIIEAPIGEHTVEEVCAIMSQNPEWCPDCPLAAAGYLAPSYYFKD